MRFSCYSKIAFANLCKAIHNIKYSTSIYFWIWKVWKGREKITKIWRSWERKEILDHKKNYQKLIPVVGKQIFGKSTIKLKTKYFIGFRKVNPKFSILPSICYLYLFFSINVYKLLVIQSFLDEIKSISHSFWRAIIWWKNKKIWKRSFNILSPNFTKWSNTLTQFVSKLLTNCLSVWLFCGIGD